MAEQLFKKKSSPEERKYQEAAGLQDSVSYVVRFERKVIALNNAAGKFEKLGDYKDAAKRADDCRKAAQEAEKTGCKETFELALQKEKQASTKSDWIDAIAEFKRVWKQPDYEKEAREHINICKKNIGNLERKRIWKVRLITLAVVILAVGAFTQTIAYPFLKGMVHQQLGHYQAALNNYKVSQGMPGANGKLRACYYYLGQESLDEGNQERALQLFAKAKTYEDAAKKTADLEQKFVKKAEKGDVVRYGQAKWVVLDKKKDKVLLLCNKLDKKIIYSDKGNTVWEKSDIYNWLHSGFATQTFSEEESSQIVSLEQLSAKKDENQKGYAFLLSSQEYETYRELVTPKAKNWWLRDEAVLSASEAEYVNAEGSVKKTYVNNVACYVRPAIWVDVE
ncbi:MAG: DUF6273 domain-containing protein [Butyribacter sp.]|nr:DUF6273 domain-containing protein [bacterium]MDY3854170.1 DUF6273 domain-containing protein [Butyribacter sp.]